MIFFFVGVLRASVLWVLAGIVAWLFEKIVSNGKDHYKKG